MDGSKLPKSYWRVQFKLVWVSVTTFQFIFLLLTGLYIVFVLGINTDPTAIALQLGGILISIISLTKGVAEYQVTASFEKESNIVQTLKSMVFIFPHTLVRVVSFSLIVAFLKFYSAVPAAILLIANAIIAVVVARVNNQSGFHNEGLLASLLLGLCSPFCLDPASVLQHRYLRRSLLSTNILILSSLLFLRCFPFVLPPHLISPQFNLGSKNVIGNNIEYLLAPSGALVVIMV